MVKKIKNNDVYELQVVGNRIIINDNCKGLCIYDFKMNLIKKLKLIKGLLIHEAFVIDEQSMILYCYDNSLFIYVNCVNYKYKIIKIKKKQRKYNPKEVIFFDGKKCVFQAYERYYLILNIKKKTLEIKPNKKMNIERNVISKKDMIQKAADYYNSEWDYWIAGDMKDDKLVLLNEDKIILYNSNGKIEFTPDKKYYFGRVKFICDGSDVKLVTLSFYNPNQYVSKIIIQKI